jgi:tetratricopeptide (TPR) repeat protein
MLRRYWFWGLVVAFSSMLLSGCRSSTGHESSGSEPSAVIAKPGPALDADAEKVARAHAHYGAGIIHDMNEETGPALEEYYQAALEDPDNERLVLEVSRRFLKEKQQDKALELLTRAGARPNASGAVMAQLGMVYSQLGKYEQAVAADRAAIKRAPTLLAGYQNLFVTYMQNKQEAEALKVLDEAGRQPNTDAEFLVTLSELYGSFVVQWPSQKTKVRPKALAVLNRAEKLEPSTPSLRLRMAEGYLQAGEPKQAAEIYQDLLKKLPDVPFIRESVRAKLAEIYLQDSDHKRATEQLEAIARDDPTNPRIYYYLGMLAYSDQKPAEAAEHFHKCILLSPEFKEAYFDLALAQISLNKTGDALATLDQVRRRFPESAQTFITEFYTGLAYSRQKAYREALEHYTEAEVIAKARETNHLGQDLYFQLGAAAERTGDLGQAEKYFRRCLEYAPDSAEAQNYLGYMWAEHGMKLDQARDLIQKAVKAEPKNAAYLDSLGWVLFKLNQPKEALGYVLKAVELSRKEEEDATLYEHLGDIYAALKQADKAREAWTKSLTLEPNDEVRKKLGQDPRPESQKPPANGQKGEGKKPDDPVPPSSSGP